jgi:hypothetical protein
MVNQTSQSLADLDANRERNNSLLKQQHKQQQMAGLGSAAGLGIAGAMAFGGPAGLAIGGVMALASLF